MSPRRMGRYGNNFSYELPRPPKMNLLTSRWSPTSSVCSIDCEGILNAWTTKLVPNSARITVTSSDSAYSRSEVRSLSSFRPITLSVSARRVASAMFLLTSFFGGLDPFERLARCGLLCFFLLDAGAGRQDWSRYDARHDEGVAVVVA